MQMVGLLLPSDFIGRPGRETLDFDVVAASDVTLCSFERKPFEKVLAETPHISQRLVEMAMDELDAARDWMVLLGRKTAREKLASFIQMLVQRTLETVSRQFTQFRKDGIVEFTDRRHFSVKDHAALLDATGDDADGGVIV